MDMTARATPTGATTLTTTGAGGISCGGIGGGLSIVPPTKSPEAEIETPPWIQPSKPISFSNGVLKRHAPPPVLYKECLKNHAASLGGHALDGCGEFMPAPNATSSDPTSLKCAACGCHRNFHRREPEEANVANTATTTLTHVIEYHPHHRHHPLPPPSSTPHTVQVPSRGVRSPGSQSPPPISSTYYPGSAPQMLLALSSGGPDATTPTTNGAHHPQQQHQHQHQHQHHQNNVTSQYPQQVMMNSSSSQLAGSRKRFRTKFSQEQKAKMHEFAEKVGWKMQKINEEMVNGFCNEIGVERGVFKVWMHNNKNTFVKRSNTTPIHPANIHPTTADNHAMDDDEEKEVGNVNGNGNDNSNNSSINNHDTHHHHQQQHYNGDKSNAAPTNASSSSS